MKDYSEPNPYIALGTSLNDVWPPRKRFARNLILAIVIPAIGYAVSHITHKMNISHRNLLWVGLPSFFIGLTFAVRSVAFARNAIQVSAAVAVLLTTLGLIAWVGFLWFLLITIGNHMGMLWLT